MVYQLLKSVYLVIIFGTIISFLLLSGFNITSSANAFENAFLNKISNGLSGNNSSKSLSDPFLNLFIITNKKSANLTSQYNNEILLWQKGNYSNSTMAKITENYLPRFITQLNDFNSTQVPIKYYKIKENFVKSLGEEIKSYDLFRDYLLTGNSTKNALSTDYLSKSLEYEELAFKEFNNANKN